MDSQWACIDHWQWPISKFQAESESGYNASLLRKLVQVSGTPCLNLGKGLCSTSQAINITHTPSLVVILWPESNSLAHVGVTKIAVIACDRLLTALFIATRKPILAQLMNVATAAMSEKCHDHYPESQDNQARMDLIGKFDNLLLFLSYSGLSMEEGYKVQAATGLLSGCRVNNVNL